MILSIYFKDTGKISIRKKELLAIIEKVIAKEGLLGKKIDIIITNDERLQIINEKYLNNKDYTDIITFRDIGKESVGGEIYISLERVRANSKKFSENRLISELYRVIIHGILHLVGYNDLTIPEKKQMTQMEDYYLKELNLQIGKAE